MASPRAPTGGERRHPAPTVLLAIGLVTAADSAGPTGEPHGPRGAAVLVARRLAVIIGAVVMAAGIPLSNAYTPHAAHHRKPGSTARLKSLTGWAWLGIPFSLAGLGLADTPGRPGEMAPVHLPARADGEWSGTVDDRDRGSGRRDRAGVVGLHRGAF